MVESTQQDGASHARQEGGRTKESTGTQIATAGPQLLGGEWSFRKRPDFLKERVEYFASLFEAQKEKYAAMPHNPITITMPDGKVHEGVSFETTPFNIAKSIGSQFAKKVLVAQVRYPGGRIATLDDKLMNPEEDKASQGEGWIFFDMARPFEGNAELKMFTFDDAEGKETFWHSSAHVLGESLEIEYGVHLTHGPPTDSGFFYDSYTGGDKFNETNYKAIEACAKKITSEKQKFERLVLTKDEALKLFGHNPFKVALIQSKITDGSSVTAYRSGDLIDLCTGPHVPSTENIKAFKVLKNSSSNWLSNTKNDSLQRIYGVAFPSKKELDEYIFFLEEAKKRDHRTIGRQQGLFDMHELSPGCAFQFPMGTVIYNKLVDMIKRQYRVRGYAEVISPNVFNLKLWKTSGHYTKYKDNLFLFQVEKQGFGMKPMNCPAHCLMFDNEIRSYKELPIRMADFGVLHRNELSGALNGLTRVRRFCQDDAHIFCRGDQLMQEVLNTLDFLEYVYGNFGFHFELELSTRPEARLGSDDLWDQAEAALESALNKFGKPWKLNAGDGAFYGPKIDIKVYDALKRAHQCGTVQLDFQLPIRFNLQYQSETAAQDQANSAQIKEDQKNIKLDSQLFKGDEYDAEDFTWQERHLKPGFQRPVIVHRAILGSVERFMAILIEHLAGKWPFWMSPRQCIVVPISEKSFEYAESVYKYLHQLGYECDWDKTNGQLNKKIRNAQLAQWNYILVCGEDEAKDGLLDVRTRDNQRHGKMRVNELADRLAKEKPAESKFYTDFYANAWDPTKFGLVPATEENLEAMAQNAEETKESAPQKEEAAEATAEKKPYVKKAKYQKAPEVTAPVLPEEWDVFNKCDLRVGKITECEVHPESEKLYIEKVDVAEAEVRTIGSGLQKFCTMEEMMNGQNVMIWANLKQKKLGGVPSHGMVMCANAHDMDPPQCEIVRPPTDAKVGERIQLEGNPILNAPLSEERAAELNPKKKLEPKFMALLKTNDDGHVCYNGVRLMTSAGPLTVATLKNAPVS